MFSKTTFNLIEDEHLKLNVLCTMSSFKVSGVHVHATIFNSSFNEEFSSI